MSRNFVQKSGAVILSEGSVHYRSTA